MLKAQKLLSVDLCEAVSACHTGACRSQLDCLVPAFASHLAATFQESYHGPSTIMSAFNAADVQLGWLVK